MASYTERKNKDGVIISYQIKVERGRDLLTGKRLAPYTMTYNAPDGWSDNAIKRELTRIMGEFEAACKRGEVLTKAEKKEQAQATKQAEAQRLEDEKKKPSFAKYAEVYLKEREPIIAANTYCRYEAALNRAALTIGNMKMADIDIQTMREYFKHLQIETVNQKTGGRLSYGSVCADYDAIKVFFEKAVENEIIDDSPMRKMKTLQRLKSDVIKEPLVYDEKQIEYIIKCTEKERLMWRAFVRLAIDSGCRKGELVGLKWSEIDFINKRITICRNAQYMAGKGVYIDTPKSKKNRVIFINDEVMQILAEWKTKQAEKDKQNGVKPSGFCFTAKDGTMIFPYTPAVYLKAFGKKYNLEGIHAHTFRHTMATLSIANGADVVSVSEKLGHSSPTITLNKYSHANATAEKRASEIMAKFYSNDNDRKEEINQK